MFKVINLNINNPKLSERYKKPEKQKKEKRKQRQIHFFEKKRKKPPWIWMCNEYG